MMSYHESLDSCISNPSDSSAEMQLEDNCQGEWGTGPSQAATPIKRDKGIVKQACWTFVIFVKKTMYEPVITLLGI